jgi:hypothetical protein
MEAWIDLGVAAALAALGVGLAWVELRRRRVIAASEGRARLYLQQQLRRRIRVAMLLMLLAAIIIGARWIDPDQRPIPYLLLWFVAAVVALRLIWLAVVDYVAARLHWVDQTQQTLVDIARARAALRDLESRRRSEDSE